MTEQATPNQPRPDSSVNRDSSASTVAIYQPQWDTWTRRVVVVLLILAGLFVVSMLGPVIQTLATAFLIAFVMFPPAGRWPAIRRCPTGWRSCCSICS